LKLASTEVPKEITDTLVAVFPRYLYYILIKNINREISNIFNFLNDSLIN
jgi:hypothetical protein